MLRYKLKNGVVSSAGDYDKAMSDALLLLVNGRMAEAEFYNLAKSKGKELGPRTSVTILPLPSASG